VPYDHIKKKVEKGKKYREKLKAQWTSKYQTSPVQWGSKYLTSKYQKNWNTRRIGFLLSNGCSHSKTGQIVQFSNDLVAILF
jgi:hypothetical protein